MVLTQKEIGTKRAFAYDYMGLKIVLTGANGYIGMRLLPELLRLGHKVVCVVRNAQRLSVDAQTRAKIDIIEVDFLETPSANTLPKDIDIAYFLIHSMSSSTKDFDTQEAITARNFNHCCLLYTSPSPRDLSTSRMPSSA